MTGAGIVRARVQRAREQGRESGATLAELLVTITLLAMVTTMLVGLVVSVSRTFTENRALNDSTNMGSTAMNETTRVIRAGTEIRESGVALNRPVFTSIANESLTMHAFIDADALDPQPIQVRFYMSPLPDGTRELREARFEAIAGSGPFWTFATTPVTDRMLTRHVPARVGGEPWLFSYQTVDVVPAAVVPSTTSATAAITAAATLRTVGRVTVALTVQTDPTARARPMVLINEVGIPNLGIDRVGAGS